MKRIQLNKRKIVAKNQAKRIRENIRFIKRNKLFDVRYSVSDLLNISFLMYKSGNCELFFNNEILEIKTKQN